jgi:hypothetical protein
VESPRAPASPSGWRDWPAGARVVVRRRLGPAESGGKLWTDVIGVVLEVDDGGIRLRTDSPRSAPQEVFVAADDVEAAKRIPPRPAPR